MTTASFDPDNKKAALFLKNSNQEKIQLATILEGIHRHAPALERRILNPLQEFYLYFSGARNGLLEIPLITKFVKGRHTMKEMTLICQGISPILRRSFQQGAFAAGIGELAQEYQIVPFEEPLYVPPHAHFSLVAYEWNEIHSWKETPKEHHALMKFKNTLHSDGIGLVIFRYWRGEALPLYHIISSSLSSEFPLVNGEEVIEELAHLEIHHRAYIVDITIRVSSCFQGEHFEPNEEGAGLLSYILQAEWNLLSEEVKEAIGKELASIKKQNKAPILKIQQLFIWIFPGVMRTPPPRRYER